jgi:hypothetical protein
MQESLQNFANMLCIVIHEIFTDANKVKICVYSCEVTSKISLPEICHCTTFEGKQSKDHRRTQYVIPVI